MVVTNNRRDFLKEYLKFDMHNGLVVLVPNVERAGQVQLFEQALDKLLDLGDDLVNKLIEVLADGSVHVREWTRERHDLDHIGNPD